MQLYALLLPAMASPCDGCGTGLLRRTHARAELKQLSLPELDALVRETEDARDEAVGTREARAAKHAKALAGLNRTLRAAEAELTGHVREQERALQRMRADYRTEWDEVAHVAAEASETSARLQVALQQQASRQKALKRGLAQLRLCCKGTCVPASLGFLRASVQTLHAVASAGGLDLSSERDALLDKFVELCRAHGGGWPLSGLQAKLRGPGEAKFRLIFAVEKLESELLGELAAAKGEEARFGAQVRALQAWLEAMRRNGTSVLSRQAAGAETLKTRMAAQTRSLALALVMASDKAATVDAAEGQAAHTEERLEALWDVLTGCGCAKDTIVPGTASGVQKVLMRHARPRAEP